MSRRALLLLGAIAVLAVVLAVVGQRRGSAPGGTGDLLLPGLAESLNDVERVVVTKSGNEVVATLVRGADGWTVAEKADYPADIAKIRQALVALSEAKTIEEKTSDPAFYDRLAVESIDGASAGGLAVTITGGALALPTVILGNVANSTRRYARLASAPRSFLIDRNPDFPRTTSGWLVTDIVDLRPARVAAVTITHDDGETLTIAKNDQSDTNYSVADIPEGRELLYPGVANVIGGALRELKLEDVARVPETPPAANVTTEFRTFDGLVVTAAGTTYSDESWLTFAARTAGDSSAPEHSGADGSDDAAGAPPAAAEDTPATAPDPATEAAAINARVSGWRYRIATYQYDQLTRRMADLLKAPPSE